MFEHEKSCVYCRGFIAESASTCNLCGKDQIEWDKARDEFLRSSMDRLMPFAVAFTSAWWFVTFIFLPTDTIYFREVFELVILHGIMIPSIAFVWIMSFMPYVYYQNEFGINRWVFQQFRVSVRRLYNKIFKRESSFDPVEQPVPSVPAMSRATNFNNERAKSNWKIVFGSLAIIFSFCALGIHYNPDFKDFKEFISWYGSFDEHYVDEIIDAKVFSIYSSVSFAEEGEGDEVEYRGSTRIFIGLASGFFLMDNDNSYIPTERVEVEEWCLSKLRGARTKVLGTHLPQRNDNYFLEKNAPETFEEQLPAHRVLKRIKM